MKHALVALLLVAAGLTAGAQEAAAGEPLLCTLSQIRICTETGDCKVRTADELGVPRFIVVDTKAKKFRAVVENRESKILSVTSEEGLLFLQGMENKRAWSAVISDSENLTLVATSDGTAFAVFGSCVSMDKLEK
jgi:hypothetical protein